LQDEAKASLRKFLQDSAQNIHVTGNKHDLILGGQGEREALQMAEVLQIEAKIEEHSEGEFLGSHYISDNPAVHPAAETSVEMIRHAHLAV
jgi:hypothetical protein